MVVLRNRASAEVRQIYGVTGVWPGSRTGAGTGGLAAGAVLTTGGLPRTAARPAPIALPIAPPIAAPVLAPAAPLAAEPMFAPRFEPVLPAGVPLL